MGQKIGFGAYLMMTVCSASTKYDSRARMKNPRCFRLRKSFSSATSEIGIVNASLQKKLW